MSACLKVSQFLMVVKYCGVGVYLQLTKLKLLIHM